MRDARKVFLQGSREEMSSSLLCPRCGLKNRKLIPAPFTKPYEYVCERCFRDMVAQVSEIYEKFFWDEISKALKKPKPLRERHFKRLLRTIKTEDFYRPWIMKFLERSASIHSTYSEMRRHEI